MQSKYEIAIYWSFDDQAYLAEAPELAGCMADGETYAIALARQKEQNRSRVRAELVPYGEANAGNECGPANEWDAYFDKSGQTSQSAASEVNQ